MSSTAHNVWANQRASRIDYLLAAHAALGGAGPGRRWRTEPVNWSIVLRLAAEFQGYARDLHNLAVDCCSTEISGLNPALANVVQIEMTRNRLLDRGNANPGSLGTDFGRLGLLLWPALERTGTKAQTWNRHLEALNVARNAIAHSDHNGFLKLHQLGYSSITLSVAKKWRASLDALATAMDDVVADYLTVLLGGQRPW